MGTIVIGDIRQMGYTKDFAAGVICNAGTLGILVPPSIVMVVYAASVEMSGGRMFLASVITGLLAGFMLITTIYVIAKTKNLPKGEWKGWGEIVASGRDAGWGLFLIVIILGGIYGGIFTPTEAAAVAAVYAFIIASFVYKNMGPLSPVTSTASQSLSRGGGRYTGQYCASSSPVGNLYSVLPPRHDQYIVRRRKADSDIAVRHCQCTHP